MYSPILSRFQDNLIPILTRNDIDDGRLTRSWLQFKSFAAIIVLLNLPYINPAAQENPDFNQIDKHASRAPEALSEDLGGLVKYLTEPAKTDIEKIRSLYVWIKQNIRYDKKGLAEDKLNYNFDPQQILIHRKAICTGYSRLFEEMSKSAGFEAQTIPGYSKSIENTPPEYSAPDHAWNAVKINGHWYLLDVTWGANISNRQTRRREKKREQYFLADPQTFVEDHLPAFPMWQLMDYPLSVQEYKSNSAPQRISDGVAYAYRDSIDWYLELPELQQQLFRYQRTFVFNPTEKNKNLLGHALLDFASSLSDSLNYMNIQSEIDLVLKLQRKIMDICDRAERLCQPHNWHFEMHAETLINHAVALYQVKTTRSGEQSVNWTTVLEYLVRAKEVLDHCEPGYYKEMASSQCRQYMDIVRQMIEEK